MTTVYGPQQRQSFWLRPPGLILIAAAVLVTVVSFGAAIGVLDFSRDKGIRVKVTTCTEIAGFANAGLEVSNTGKVARSATVLIEYRDEAGRRIDVDETTVNAIAPGDTVRTNQATLLDANPKKVACSATITAAPLA